MSLTSGTGPLSRRRAGRFTAPVPDGVAYVEPFRRRVRGVRGGEAVVDTEQALLVHRPGAPPVWAIPRPHARDVPTVAVAEAPGHVEVPWDAVDTWYQEEDEVLLHAPNPYHRVEYLRSSRRLRVEVADVVVVDTTDTIAVYETALEPRLYVARDAVRVPLRRSATSSVCPYKGVASWWTTRVDGDEAVDVAWSYDDPRPEAAAIAGLVSFDEHRTTVTTDLPR